MAEAFTPMEAILNEKPKVTFMERGFSQPPEMEPKKKPESTMPINRLESVESLESTQEKVEAKPAIEEGVVPIKRPESGLQLLLWRIVENMVIVDLNRQELIKSISEKSKTTEQLKLILLIIESKIAKLVKTLYVPVIKLFLKDYSESLNDLLHGRFSAENSIAYKKQEHSSKTGNKLQ